LDLKVINLPYLLSLEDVSDLPDEDDDFSSKYVPGPGMSSFSLSIPISMLCRTLLKKQALCYNPILLKEEIITVMINLCLRTLKELVLSRTRNDIFLQLKRIPLAFGFRE